MPYVGWGTVTNQANTTTGGAAGTVADVSGNLSTGFGVGGGGTVNLYSEAPGVAGYILLEDGDDLLLESGDFILLE
jgi:hypothetical protein